MTNYLLYDGSGVEILRHCAEAPELVFLVRTQESYGGQRDVCGVKELLDLLGILCASDREGG